MQTTTINFEIPSSWAELNDKELRFVYRLISSDFSSDEIKTLCLLRWSNTKVIGRQDTGAYLLKKDKSFFEVTTVAIAEILSYLEWLDNVSPVPVRISKLHGHKALPADFCEVPLEKYIIVDNLYQGYLETQSDDLLDELASVLYDHDMKLNPEERTSVFFWVMSLKEFLAKKFPDFLQPASEGVENGGNLLSDPVCSTERRLRESTDSMIRALTKGDISKEERILSLDTWRALTELDAQAREYKQLNAINGK